MKLVQANTEQSEKEKHRHFHQSVFLESKTVGVDLMFATDGQTIDEEQLLALQYAGYLGFGPREITNVFYDVDDYNDVVQSYYEEERQIADSKRQEVLTAMNNATGLPKELFWPLEAIRGAGPTPQAILREGAVDDEVKIQRFTRFQLAKQLLSAKDLSERRFLALGLGLSIVDGAPDSLHLYQGTLFSSYQSEITKVSLDTIKQADVELAADGNGWFDFIFPTVRRKHLDEVAKAANSPIIIPLAKSYEAYPILTPDVFLDKKHRRLLVGNRAVTSTIERGVPKNSILKVGELLVQERVDLRLGELNPYQYSDWERQRFLNYGQWLIQILDPLGRDINARIIARARKLGLGPGVDALMSPRTFGSLGQYYGELNLSRRPKGKFAHWEQDDWARWAQRVVDENDGNITKEIIVARSQNSLTEPTWKMVLSGVGNMTNLVTLIGREPYHRKQSLEECLEKGVAFYLDKGRLPQKKDFKGEPSNLPRLGPIYKYCGGIQNFGELILDAAAEKDAEIAA